ncbi:hypothetical protein [Hymenobacter sp. B81]|uniref:EF-Tu C-terminal domain-related protein n=1 Tax=Hymenobacter sp. B81 TaxID=3344878 RepID=UPI0037DD2D24
MPDCLLRQLNTTPESHVKASQKNVRPEDFIALIRYNTAEEGGRRTPVRSGYRAQVRFPFDEMQTSGLQVFINQDECWPGEEVEAKVYLVSACLFERKLLVGEVFEIREGARVVGIGVIKQFTNEKLRRAADAYSG